MRGFWKDPNTIQRLTQKASFTKDGHDSDGALTDGLFGTTKISRPLAGIGSQGSLIESPNGLVYSRWLCFPLKAHDHSIKSLMSIPDHEQPDPFDNVRSCICGDSSYVSHAGGWHDVSIIPIRDKAQQRSWLTRLSPLRLGPCYAGGFSNETQWQGRLTNIDSATTQG